MAWNKYYVFVKAPESNDLDALLTSLGLGHYKPVEEVPLHDSNKPKTLFAGFYQGNLLLVHPDLAFHFFGEGQSETEQLFTQTFPGKEIAALIENSTVGLFGYAVLEDGHKIRMKDGADGEIYHDAGELLPEEQEILAEEIFGEEELDEMREDGMSEEEVQAMVSFEASWRVPNLLSARYLGEPVGAIDTAQVMLTRYV
ncbi:DUF6928 family protein [Hymenobacter nivis]|uniref:Uncharacterized protein n=1 Tax=Hymenobacter nivis TaxID=1850093 RepID=A0A502GAV0_9BACT|nr:hypothetical protein [Hymenobacter nivis]TPG58954.1 hypothetical protein EAH73_21790 [Hymenobacter nivis]